MTPRKLIVGGASLNQTPLDWDGNLRRIRQAIQEAKANQVSILCLPELCLSGYGCEDAFHAEGVSALAFQSLLELLPDTQNIAVAVGLPIHLNQVVYNAIAWLVNGKLEGIVAKQFLAGQDLYYEPRWFKAWPAGMKQWYQNGKDRVPFGDLVFDLDGLRVGFEICEDAWVANRPASRLAGLGVDIFLNASASHFAFGQFDIRRQIVEEGARSTNSTYVYANLLGCESGRIIYDGTVMVASGNDGLIAEGRRFSYAEHVLTFAEIDIDRTRLQRRKNTNYQPSVEGSPNIIFCQFPPLSATKPKSTTSKQVPYEKKLSLSKNEEFTQAVALGLWDYLRKSRSQGFVVSLSGGADSATVAMLVYLMARFALRELSWNKFRQQMAHLGWLPPQEKWSIEQIMPHLLHTVYQASDNSGPVTFQAAKTVAEGLHARFLEFNISGVVDQYVQWMEGVLERPMSWDSDDLPLQNIQARVRAPSAWLLANTYGALLLSTSNRSEAAVGYATMDGDTCGGLSPIAGIDKAFILEWLKWVETHEVCGLENFPMLQAITEQQPTAELRPVEEHQSDEADLMPYPLLDAIERMAIRDRKMPLQVWMDLQLQFDNSAYSGKQLGTFVEKFFQLWSRNQWKRERYAPSFHLDDENLDPKTWCRFPILSGGFSKELQLLKDAVAQKR